MQPGGPSTTRWKRCSGTGASRPTSVHQLASVPNTVLVLHHFATVAQAQGFLTNRELQAAMQRAGVEGDPRVEIYA